MITRYFNPRAGRGPIQYYRVLPAGARVWGWLRFGFCVAFGRSAMVLFSLSAVSRAVLVSVVLCGGGFVYPYCRFPLGVGFGLSRLALILIARGGLVLVPLSRRLVLVDPRKNLKNSRCKLNLFR